MSGPDTDGGDAAAMRVRRGTMLMQQSRHDEARAEFAAALAESPQDPSAHAMLAVSLSIVDDDDRESLRRAIHHADTAVGLDPASDFVFAIRSQVQSRLRRYDDALESIERAIAIDPDDPDHYAQRAELLVQRRRYDEALADAERGLAIDGEHQSCWHMRSLALERLGRGDDATSSATAAVRRRPDDADTHAMLGLAHLNEGRHREARESFREALRLNPNSDVARYGLLESIKSRNPLYRCLHRYFVWIGRLDRRAAFGIMIGLWLSANNADAIAAAVPFLKPVIRPLLFVYAVFAVTTWLGSPLMDAMLRLHPFGKHLLTRRQRISSNVMIAVMLSCGAVAALVARTSLVAAAMLLLYGLVTCLLIAATARMPYEHQRWTIGALSAAVAAVPLMMFALAMMGAGGAAGSMLMVFVYGVVGIQIGSQVWAARDNPL